MLFKHYQSVLANTTKGAPNWQKLTIAKGEIKQWLIFFDPDAADLLHIKIEYHNTQILPFSGNKWLTGFLIPITLDEKIKIDDPQYILDIYAYNEDTKYPHEYFVHVVIEPKEPVTVTGEIEGLWDRLKGFIGLGE